MSSPISFSSQIFLVWAEPDEGSYNYQLYPLRSRWAGTPEAKVPDEIADRIRLKASPYYPILVADGFFIDGLIDAVFEKDRPSVLKSFGEFPRTRIFVSGGKRPRSSVEEFFAAVSRGEKF